LPFWLHFRLKRQPRNVCIIQGPVTEWRSLWLGPWNPRDREIARYFGGGPAWSGVSVTQETALACSAFWCAATTIAADVASLPLPLYRRLPNGGKERFETHALYRLIHDRPNPQMTSMQFRETLMLHTLISGNGYAEVERDGAGRPAALWPVPPERMTPIQDGDCLRYRIGNYTRRPTRSSINTT
jgi:phage portal protein BeeE